MTVSALLTRTCTIKRRTAAGTIDAAGDAVVTTVDTSAVCELQQLPRRADGEPVTQAEMSDSQWLLVLPAGTAIDTGDGVVVDGKAYEMFGEPWHVRHPRTGVESHVECTLHRTAGAGDTA